MARSLTVLLFLVLAASAAAAPPTNDNRAGAIAFNGAPALGTTLDATGEAGEPQPTANTLARRCAAQTDGADCIRTVWYDFQPVAGSWVVETCDRGTDMNTLLGIYTSDMSNALTKVTSNAQGSNCPGGTFENGSRATFTADGTTTYRIQVAGRLGSAGLFYLRAYPAPAAGYAAADTLIERYQSFAVAKNITGSSNDGVQSGGRRTASFSFSATANGDFTTAATFECALDAGAFAACTSPVSFDGLAAGQHDFKVRATTGGNTDATPAVQRFTIDTTPPDTTLRSGPTGNTTADLVYQVDGSEHIDSLAWGRCGFDSQPLLPCNFSSTFSLVSGCLAAHTFTAAATDQAGYLDTTPLVVTATRTNNGLNCAAPTLSGQSGSGVVTGGGASVQVDAEGYGGALRMDYGTTSSYGLSQSIGVANGGQRAISLSYLEPSTTYHYKFTLTTPGGTASTADDTFSTGAVVTTRDAITAGTPVAIGQHALRIPVHVTVPATEQPVFGVFLDDSGSAAQVTSARVEAPDLATATGDYFVEVVDLDPGVTYSLRGFVQGSTTMATAPFTFTMPGTAQATVTPTASSTVTATATATRTATATGTATASPTATATSSPPTFTLAASNVRVKKLKHSSKAIRITISGTPVGTTVKAKAKGYGKATGTTRLKIKLDRKARKKLHKRKTKTVKIKLTATPPGAAATSVTVKAKLKR